MPERGDDGALGGEHLTVHTDPLKGLRASLLVEAEGVEIEPLPRSDSRNSQPPIGEAGRGGAEPAVAIEHEDGTGNGHQRSPMTGCASRIRWSKPVS